MIPKGRVLSIHLAARKGGPLSAVETVRATAGGGLAGDRYARPPGKCEAKCQATLIADEAIEAARREHGVSLASGSSRRNITTRGVALNSLVGREFSVGEVRMRGAELCQPCAYLERLTEPGVCAAFADRCGLRAEILSDGIIRVGDPIVAG